MFWFVWFLLIIYVFLQLMGLYLGCLRIFFIILYYEFLLYFCLCVCIIYWFTYIYKNIYGFCSSFRLNLHVSNILLAFCFLCFCFFSFIRVVLVCFCVYFAFVFVLLAVCLFSCKFAFYILYGCMCESMAKFCLYMFVWALSLYGSLFD